MLFVFLFIFEQIRFFHEIFSLYDSKWSLFMSRWLNDWFLIHLDVNVIFFIWIIVVCMSVNKQYFCMIVKCVLSYIQFIYLFVTYFDRCVVLSHLNHCSEYDYGWFTVSGLFVKFWNSTYCEFISLIDSFPTLICLVFFFFELLLL